MADIAVPLPLPGMPPAPVYREFGDDEIRSLAVDFVGAVLYQEVDRPRLWESLPGHKGQIRPEDVHRFRVAILKIADEVSNRG